MLHFIDSPFNKVEVTVDKSVLKLIKLLFILITVYNLTLEKTCADGNTSVQVAQLVSYLCDEGTLCAILV